MSPGVQPQRINTEERREMIVQAAIDEFGRNGYHGGSTERIAKQVGITQPYIFKLFGTKRELFLVCLLRVCEHVRQTFQNAVVGSPEEPLKAMGMAYFGLLERRSELQVLLHAFAASADPEIQVIVREEYINLYRFVQELTGEEGEAVSAFFAQGMFITIASAIGLPEIIYPKLPPDPT